MSIKVRATRLGFYGTRRRPGDEFDINSKDELGSWMEIVKKTKVEKPQEEKPSEAVEQK